MRALAVRSFICFLVLLLGGCALTVNWALTPMAYHHMDGPSEVTIPPGSTARDIAGILYRDRFIKHPLLFEMWVRYKGVENQLVAGDYEIDRTLSISQIIQLMVEGRICTISFTVPEGLTVVQAAQAIEEQGICASADFLGAARDSPFNRMFLPSGIQLDEPMEGYLFPETYRIARGTGPVSIVGLMYRGWEERFAPDRRQRAGELGLSVHEVLTLASIIEREALKPEERKLISGVFHNRLKMHMRLDADPTVLYALGKPGGDLTLNDLAVDSPYNTYKYGGLPPGPICNPGEACIDAALFPEDTDYLYFVARNDGTHDFSTSLAEHLTKKRKYQSEKGKATG